MILFAIIGVLTAATAIMVQNYLKGERLLHDLIDEARLARRTLQELDEAWSHNPLRSDVVVTLTTIPSRAGFLAPTLKSLLRQSLPPQRIVLNVPVFCHRENSACDLPEELKALRCLDIRWVDDVGPATKLLPTLHTVGPHQWLAVVDDDRMYPADFLQRLRSEAEGVRAYSGWCAPDDLIDRPTTLWSNIKQLAPTPIRALRISAPVRVDIVQGAGGYLLQPAFLDLAAVHDYSHAPDAARRVDDVWISAHCNAPKHVIPARRACYQSKRRMWHYHRTSLGLLNRGPGGDHAQRPNSVMLKHFADRWLCSPRRKHAAVPAPAQSEPSNT